jgi:hypothetical protein
MLSDAGDPSRDDALGDPVLRGERPHASARLVLEVQLEVVPVELLLPAAIRYVYA